MSGTTYNIIFLKGKREGRQLEKKATNLAKCHNKFAVDAQLHHQHAAAWTKIPEEKWGSSSTRGNDTGLDRSSLQS